MFCYLYVYIYIYGLKKWCTIYTVYSHIFILAIIGLKSLYYRLYYTFNTLFLEVVVLDLAMSDNQNL